MFHCTELPGRRICYTVCFKKRVFKKKRIPLNASVAPIASEPNIRSEQDAHSVLGIATTNELERALASFGVIDSIKPHFESHNSIANGGVLFLLPALLSQGLMTVKQTHSIAKGYYGLESIILTLAFMALCRIKNPEQLKQCAPGEMGKLIGLDRVPEIKCLRSKMDELFKNNKTEIWNQKLAKQWVDSTKEDFFLYTDGHVRIYNGYLANPTKKFVSRQKLCLSATTDFWLNDSQGMPLLVFTGVLSEKLQHMIEHVMLPDLFSSGILQKDYKGDKPQCTLIFDREAYEPAFFIRLWELYRIAVITYRKNVKDQWDVQDFKSMAVIDNMNAQKTMLLCEKQTLLSGHAFREIRSLSNDDHQTAIITTHPTLLITIIAVAMFNRWIQENFFKYMIADYSLDHIAQYGVQTIDPNKEVINPVYRKINYQIKKEKEKFSRLKAKLVQTIKVSSEAKLDQFDISIQSGAALVHQIEVKQNLILELEKQKLKIPAKIKISEMPEKEKYSNLKTESNYFMVTLKMICYRAETATANLLDGKYSRYIEEKRMLLKNLITTPIDMKPDYQNNTLTIKLHSLNTPRANKSITELCQTLNESETVFPGTNLKIIYKTMASKTAVGQEF